MKNKILKNKISRFSDIMPNENFSKKSKFEILSLKPKYTHRRITNQNIETIIGRYAKTITIVSATVAIFFLTYYAMTQISPIFLPGLDHSKIIAEAEVINQKINIEVNKLNYFNKVSTQSSNALQEITENNPDHLNKRIINKETKKIDAISNTYLENINKEMDNALKQLSK